MGTRCRRVDSFARSKLVNALALGRRTRVYAHTDTRADRAKGREKKCLVASNCRSDDAVTNDRETTSCQ